MDTQEIKFSELPYYLTVKKVTDTETNTVKVVVESKVHKQRVIELPTSFTIDFVQSRPNEFRSDVLSAIIKRYGLKLESARYS